MKIGNLAAGCLCLAAAAAACLPAQAAPPPAPAANVQGVVNLTASSLLSAPGTSVGLLTAPGVLPGFASATGSSVTGLLEISGMPVPLISASAYVTTTNQSGAAAIVNGFELYHFRIDGPTDTVLVRIDALGDIGIRSVASGGSSTARGFLRIEEANNGPILVNQLIELSMPGGQIGGRFSSFVVGGDFLFKTNTIYDVRMEARLNANVFGAGVTDLYAHVDPTFTVADPYSFVFSNGFGGGVVTGGGAIPEPATWALLICGFGLAGAGLRRRRALAA